MNFFKDIFDFAIKILIGKATNNEEVLKTITKMEKTNNEKLKKKTKKKKK